MKARKWAVAGVTAGLLAGGGAGFLMSMPSGVGAATSNAVVSVADTPDGDEAAVRPQHHGQPHREGRRGHKKVHLETAASVIGVTADDLKAALQSGQSIADVATANGVDPQTVIDALVAEATDKVTERITAMVNGVRPAKAPAEAPAN